ncbi:hypothetical protein Tco_0516279 [Tanacetum coccineum]
MKVAHYHDFGLELLMPEHMWIDDVCTYDISASYGISHWWFNRQKFYIDRHTAESSRKVVRTHMRILSVVRIKAYFRYWYDYLKEITLRRADHQEYTIAEKDFKNLYLSDFEDLNLLLLQGHLNHLLDSDKRMLSTTVNLWTLVFPVSNNEQKIMRFNEIYKFSDGTLTNILEALHYRVKEFNPGKLGDFNVHTLEDPTLILEILSRIFFLRLNLPDHKSVVTGSGSSKDGDGDTSPVTADEKIQKKNDVKARSMLLMALLNEHLLTFNQYKDAKTLFAAIQTRFGGNDATKKTQKTLLKQMYENFSAPSTKSIDLIFNRLQKINTHVVVWRNKPDLDIMSFDDLYNNFKIVEQKVKGTASSSSSLSSQNMAFMSSTGSTNEVNTAYGVSTSNTQVSTASTQVSTANLSDDTVYAFLASQPNGSHLVHEDFEQIHEDDLEEMDLKWQLALLSMRTRNFFPEN